MAVNGVCRLCLSRRGLKHSLLEESSLLHKLRSCLPLTISETDSLPKKVCNTCSLKISDIYEYYNKAKNAERELLSNTVKFDISDDSNSLSDHNIKQEPPEVENENLTCDSSTNIQHTQKSNFIGLKCLTKSTQTDCAGVDFNSFVIKMIDDGGHCDNNGLSIKEEVLSDQAPSIKSTFDAEDMYDNNYSSEDDIALNEILRIPPIKLKIKKEYSETRKHKKLKKKKKDISLSSSCKKLKNRTKESPNKKKSKSSKDKSPDLFIKVEKMEQSFLDEFGKASNADKDKWLIPGASAEESKLWQCLTCFSHEKSRADLLKHYKDHVENPSKYNDNIKSDIPVKTELEIEYDATSPSDDMLDDDNPLKNKDSLDKPKRFIFIEPVQNGGKPGYQCIKCNKIFGSRRNLNRHCISHEEARPFCCNMCGRSYRRAYELLLHGRAHSGIKTLFCRYEECNYSTVYPGALHTHHKRHAPDFKYVCETCNKGFDILTWFIEHKNVHTGDKPFTCNVCNKSFIYSRYLASHRKTVHPETSTRKLLHRCDECKTEFQLRKQLQRHMSRVHKIPCNTSVLCDICGKGLSSKEHLKFHRRIHTGEKPHICRTCGKGFAKKCNLILHERVHSGEKPHICSQCGKGFSQRSTLVIHERYHTGARPYVCIKCNRGFVAKGLLSMHQKSCFKTDL